MGVFALASLYLGVILLFVIVALFYNLFGFGSLKIGPVDLGAVAAATGAMWVAYCWIVWRSRHDGCIVHEGGGRVRADGKFTCRVCDAA